MNILSLPTADFLAEVERMVAEDDLSYMDAIISWCEKRNIEIESMSSVIANNSVIKAKLQLEAERLHFLLQSIKIPL